MVWQLDMMSCKESSAWIADAISFIPSSVRFPSKYAANSSILTGGTKSLCMTYLLSENSLVLLFGEFMLVIIVLH